MTARATARKPATAAPKEVVDLPFESSLGFLLRDTSRAIARVLGARIEAHGVTMGMWFLLRLLWVEDGLTQREISQRLGIMEPSALEALRSMEKRGLIERVRSQSDRRKVHIHLSAEGKALRRTLMPLAREVNALIGDCGSPEEIEVMRGMLIRLRLILGEEVTRLQSPTLRE